MLQRKILFFIFLMTPLLSRADLAEEPPKPSESWEQMFIESDLAIAEWFNGAAQGLDLFLARKQLTRKQNKTTIKLENSTYSAEGQALKNNLGVNVDLKLPNVEEYWHLKFTSYDEIEANRGVRNSYLRETPRATNYGTTVGLFKKLGNVRTAFQPRVEFQGRLKISHSLSFESVADLKKYEVNPKLEFYANPDKGAGIFEALNFNFKLSKTNTLTFANDGDYQDKIHLYTVNNAVSLGRMLNDKENMSYTAVFTSTNQPCYHLDSYTFAVSYSRLVYKNILDFQISPHVDFSNALSFKRNLGLTLNVDLIF